MDARVVVGDAGHTRRGRFVDFVGIVDERNTERLLDPVAGGQRQAIVAMDDVGREADGNPVISRER